MDTHITFGITRWDSEQHSGIYCYRLFGINCPLNIHPWYLWLDLYGWWYPMIRLRYFTRRRL